METSLEILSNELCLMITIFPAQCTRFASPGETNIGIS